MYQFHQENEPLVKTAFALCESFLMPHLDYGEIVYNQPNNCSLLNKTESVRYNAVLGITGTIRGT